MAATVVTIRRGTGVFSDETRRTRDVSPSIAQLEPNAAPLTTLTMKARSRSASDPKVEWFEDQRLPRFDVLGGSLGAGASTMTVTNFNRFRAGDTVRVNRNEIVLVDTTPNSNTVAITRGIGGSGVSASSGNQLQILANTNREGATRRSLLTTQVSPKFNYLQIIRDPFGYTKSADKTEVFGGKDRDLQRMKALIEHKVNIESSILLGRKSVDSSSTNQPRRTTEGILETIVTNVKDVGGTLTEAELEDWVRRLFRFGSDSRALLASSKLITIMNGFSRSRLQTVVNEKQYGVSVVRYQNSGRILFLAEHKLLENESLTDLAGLAGTGIALDLMDIEMRFLNGRFTILNTNIQANDEDAVIDEYLSEVGLSAKQEIKHGELTGATD